MYSELAADSCLAVLLENKIVLDYVGTYIILHLLLLLDLLAFQKAGLSLSLSVLGLSIVLWFYKAYLF